MVLKFSPPVKEQTYRLRGKQNIEKRVFFSYLAADLPNPE
jgi:hypothetical protein